MVTLRAAVKSVGIQTKKPKAAAASTALTYQLLTRCHHWGRNSSSARLVERSRSCSRLSWKSSTAVTLKPWSEALKAPAGTVSPG